MEATLDSSCLRTAVEGLLLRLWNHPAAACFVRCEMDDVRCIPPSAIPLYFMLFGPDAEVANHQSLKIRTPVSLQEITMTTF